jgi:hypothetical protein
MSIQSGCPTGSCGILVAFPASEGESILRIIWFSVAKSEFKYLFEPCESTSIESADTRDRKLLDFIRLTLRDWRDLEGMVCIMYLSHQEGNVTTNRKLSGLQSTIAAHDTIREQFLLGYAAMASAGKSNTHGWTKSGSLR